MTNFEALLNLHPYKCSYLPAGITHKEFHTGPELVDYSLNVNSWLARNCVERSAAGGMYHNIFRPRYIWGKQYALVTKSDYTYSCLNIRDYITEGIIGENIQFRYDFKHSVEIATTVHFKFEEDLLAFRLRWGINE
jgi:hypothetical protein